MQQKIQEPNPACASLQTQALEVLKLVKEWNGMLCTGSCHGQKPGQLHCRQIGKALQIGINKVWNNIEFLLENGMLTREKDKNDTYFILTPKGEEQLQLK